jgi:hypothetical protein
MRRKPNNRQLSSRRRQSASIRWAWRMSVFTENEILPRLKEDSRVFYTADRKRLAPVFDPHMDRLQGGPK